MKQKDKKPRARDDSSSILVIGLDGNHVLKDAGVEAGAGGCSNAGDKTVVWDADFGAALSARERSASAPSLPQARCPWTVL